MSGFAPPCGAAPGEGDAVPLALALGYFRKGERVGALLLAVLASAAPAVAGEGASPAADVALLTACLEREEGASSCLGVIEAACQASHDQPDTTLAIAECHLEEADAWSEVMQEAYGRLLADARESDAVYGADSPWANAAPALVEAQAAWEAYRIAECGYAYARWGSGTMRLIESAVCQRNIIAARAMSLRAGLNQ